MSTPTRPTTDRAERLTPPAPKKRRARAASERLEANLHGIAAMFDAWTEEEWTDMVNASDAMILDDNRDYIEGQMIKEALATAQLGEVDPDHVANAN